ncbi:MAG: DUF1385 domain-containing protein [Clostridiales bacterium]|nr:DUF1385 domain-containing protein [Clostridiales bacterium]
MKQKKEGFRTTIGGQALIEGIMMRGPSKQAIVVSTKDGFVVKEEDLKFIKDKYPILGWPLVRGIVNFGSSMVNGFRALMFSASCLPLEEQEEEKSKIDIWIEKKFGGEKADKIIMTVAAVIGIALSVGLFILLPTLLAGLFKNIVPSGLLKNLIEGAFRIAIFLIYLWFSTRMKDIHRVFEYHGGEHKSIHCYEKGLALTVENVRVQPRQHPRCGTSFLFVVVIISSLVFSVVSWSNPLLRILIRILLIPVVVAFSYEINRLIGRHDNRFTRILAAPGLALQRLTVYEPDDNMIEVAIAGLKLVIPEKKGADEW